MNPKIKTALRRSAVILIIIALSVAFGFLWQKISDSIDRKNYPRQYEETVTKYSVEYGVPEYVIYAVIRTESGFDSGARSGAGALGLMQIMPDTFDWMLTGQSVDLDAISPGSMERTRSNLIRSLSAQLTAPLVLLPDEDALFLSEGIDPAVWQRIREAAAAQLNSIPLP